MITILIQVLNKNHSHLENNGQGWLLQKLCALHRVNHLTRF